MKKTIILPLVLFSLVASSIMAADVESLKEKALALREEHKALVAQVQTGEITKEEAVATWRNKLDSLKAEKDALFQERIQRLEERKNQFAERFPEKAETLEARFKEMQAKRTEFKNQRDEIQAQLQAGALTRVEAHEQRKAIVDDIQEFNQQRREDIQTRAQEFKNDVVGTGAKVLNQMENQMKNMGGKLNN